MVVVEVPWVLLGLLCMQLLYVRTYDYVRSRGHLAQFSMAMAHFEIHSLHSLPVDNHRRPLLSIEGRHK